jgi:aldehyde:ferredoxin oxidoreductase
MYLAFDVMAHGKPTEVTMQAADLVQRYGINSYEMMGCLEYLFGLYKKGVLGKGLAINTSLDMSRIGEFDFLEQLVDMIAYRKDIGADLAESTVRASVKWGRYEEDSGDGTLPFPYWGMTEHAYDPRLETEWGYGSILGERDMNEHCFNSVMWDTLSALGAGKPPAYSAEEFAKITTDKMVPFAGDMKMVDYSTSNIYSEHFAKLVAWQRHYARFWKHAALFCDFRYPDFVNIHRPDKVGLTGLMEHNFWNAVTGDDMTWEKGIELGRKIWSLDNAIWVLQGRTRDMVKFARYIFDVDAEEWHVGKFYPEPVINDQGQWEYQNMIGRRVDEVKFEEWKTLYYKLEGWDTKTGWPTRATLEGVGLSEVADKLESVKRIGASA